jgi:DNA-binding LytR/AlgR family response regulator
VFTTITSDYLADSYRVWAVHYLVKPLHNTDVDEAFSRAITVVGGKEKTLEILVVRHREFIPYADIYYIEAQARICDVHTRTGVYRPYANIQDMAAGLKDSRFVHCHRSYLVNLEHVTGMQKDAFVMRGNVLVPIRRGEAAEMRRLYENYRFEQVSGRP